MERRNFVKNITVGSAGIMVAPSLFSMNVALNNSSLRAGGLLPFILFEDCVKVVLQSTQIKDNLKEALTGDIRLPVNGNIARLASVLPDGNKKIENLLLQLQQDQGAKKIKWHDEKMAFVLGWIVYRSSIKELDTYNQKLVKKNHPIEEIRQYQDTQLVKLRFGKGKEANLDAEQFSSLMLGFIARVVTRIHTITPDKKDGGAWVLRITDWREQNKKAMELYGKAIQSPEKDKLDLYVGKCKLYNPNDPLIAGGFQLSAIGKENQSLYSKAIQQSYDALLAVQAFLSGQTDLKSVMEFA